LTSEGNPQTLLIKQLSINLGEKNMILCVFNTFQRVGPNCTLCTSFLLLILYSMNMLRSFSDI